MAENAGRAQAPPVPHRHRHRRESSSLWTNGSVNRSTSSTSTLASPEPPHTPALNGDAHSEPSNPPLGMSANKLSGLVCICHQTTGERPPGLSGASTTILGDVMYVYGGQWVGAGRLSESMFELDLVSRHWTRVQTVGEKPPPRYHHSMCALGDTKLVLFGGSGIAQPSEPGALPNGTVPLSDLYMYDIATRRWTEIHARNPPRARYAHCATSLPSSAVFSSAAAATSALRYNPATDEPNSGTIGVEIDGRGAAEMLIVGGQYGEEKYADSVDVFNFRSLQWTASTPMTLGKCGVYRSAVATLTGMAGSAVGAGRHVSGISQTSSSGRGAADETELASDALGSGAPAIFYSNYNFVSPQVDLQLRHVDGSIVDLPGQGHFKPPGLRFPTAGVIDRHLIVGGTYMRSAEHEYMLWALDLRLLAWHRIEISSGIFEMGSWNRGISWPRRNSFVVLGDRGRTINEDYSARMLNFAHLAVVELEAFGLYNDPAMPAPEAPARAPGASEAAAALGVAAMGLREVADMDILAVDGNRLPINSRIAARRWGPYFARLMSEDYDESADPGPRTSAHSEAAAAAPPPPGTKVLRSRLLFLPHTYFTVRALVHYLYTGALPPVYSPLCTPQILCSLLQIAQPYRVGGLLEATVKRLHQVLDGKSTGAIFNAAAMAAGGGRAVGSVSGLDARGSSTPVPGARHSGAGPAASDPADADDSDESIWRGRPSAVVGLQKRALRALVEGRRLREREQAASPASAAASSAIGPASASAAVPVAQAG